MIIRKCKKFLACVLVVLTAFSCMPFQAFASDAVENTTEATEKNLILDFVVEVNTVLVRYLGKVDATNEEIEAAVLNMDYETFSSAQADIEGIKSMLTSLTEEQQEQVLNTASIERLGYMEETMIKLTTPMLLADGSATLCDGKVSITCSGATEFSASNGIVNVSAEGSLMSKKTATITITNASSENAIVSFDYSASTYNSFTIAGASVSASGSYSAELAAGATITVVIVSNNGFKDKIATLTLDNFSCAANKSAYTTTFSYNTNAGQVTVAGTNVANNGTVDISKDSGAVLTATPTTGATFLGWTNESGKILSTETSYTYFPKSDATIKAVFAKDKDIACFKVGSDFVSEDLSLATAYAQSSGNSVIYLANNGTLPAGTYTIPAGITLLIPFDSANTIYTDAPEYISNYVKPTAYRTLTMASGANLVVNGVLSLPAKHFGMGGGAISKGNSPTGSVSMIKMQDNSNITINNGGTLYAYGYITGSGTVTANSGAKVYEYFQVGDFPGGSNASKFVDDEKVFLFSQYYIQNVEVAMTIYSGASIFAVATVDTSVVDKTIALEFISSNEAMFLLSSGYAIKKYDGTTDRLVIDLYGNVAVSPINMSAGTLSVDSSKFALPIMHNLTVNARSGSSFTISQDIALYPGSEINIDEGATGALAAGVKVYVYDVDSWGNYIFSGNSTDTAYMHKRFLAPPYAPGRAYTRTESDLKDAEVCVNGTFDARNGSIYTTTNATGTLTNLTTDGGANIYSTKNGRIFITPSSATTTYCAEKCVAGTLLSTVHYVTITAEQAKLKNADGSFTSTTTINDTGVDCKLFVYENGKWVHHEYKKTSETAPTCASTGSVTYTCTECGSTKTEELPKLDTHNYNENGVCVCGATIPVLIKKDNTSSAIIDNNTLYIYGLEPDKTINSVFEVNNGGIMEVVVNPKGYSATGCQIIVKKTDGTVLKTYTVVIFGDVNGDGAIDGFDALETDLAINGLTSLEGAYALAADVDGNGSVNVTDYNTICDAATLKAVISNPKATSVATVSYAVAEVEAVNFMSEAVASEACAHEYTAVVTAPTCTAKGYTTYTCGLCGDSYISDELEATGHKKEIDEEISATCTTTGLKRGTHCSTCNEVIVAQEEIPALGHDMVAFAGRPATYTVAGWEDYEQCSRCGHSTRVEIPMIETPLLDNYDMFVMYLGLLEYLAYMYSCEVPETDPADLVIKYIRTGVEKYNQGSWNIMAGYEDAGFAEFVAAVEDDNNLSNIDSPENWLAICSLKNLGMITVPNGDEMDFGHMFGLMDISYHNKLNLNHCDVAGWSGDIVDLINDTADGWADGLNKAIPVTGTVEEMVEIISKYYLADPDADCEDGGFDLYDMMADLDGYYFMKSTDFINYRVHEDEMTGDLALAFMNYYTEELNQADRAKYFLENRLGTTGTREQIRNAVYTAYTGNKMIATLEDTKQFKVDDITDLRTACCYAFADYVCKLAGDYVENTENDLYTVFNSEYSTLAPGITQTVRQATTADGKRMVYYLATADINRDDVNVYANYANNDPSKGWQMQTVEAQMRAAQANNADVENYKIIAGVNGSGFNMGTGEPSGLLIMDGVVYQEINSQGFFGIDNDGNAVIATTEEYNTKYKGKIKEAISGFGSFLIKDGEIVVSKDDNYTSSRASRTAVGITATGKVVFMVVDGRQEPVSCGASMVEIAQILYEAGCVQAVNLDGGGSTTYVAKQEGADDFAVANKPSDGYARSVSTSLYVASTAPSSTAFDHAIIDSDYDYATVNSTVNFTAKGVSVTGNEADLPEDAYWTVDDSTNAAITNEGVLTVLKDNVVVTVKLMSGDAILATKTVSVVTPTSIYFSKSNMNVIYGREYNLPLVARYGNKKVAINTGDIAFVLSNTTAGTITGFTFVGNESSGIKNTSVTASLVVDSNVTATIKLALNKVGEATFDFDNATCNNRQFAWNRVISNTTTTDNLNYEIVDVNEDVVTSYTFAIDMTQLEIPEQLQDIVYMLPGAGDENVSAWNFLLQLAERVSDMSTVYTKVTFDKNFDVDYSDIKLVADYFTLSGKEFDEETNTLTVQLKWIKQSQPIDAETANPLCIVSGIKVSPKSTADWGSNNKLNAVANGQVDYKIYLRANALYNFATKPENQEVFGLYPFVNPNLETERGGYFESVHAEFNDNYTLVGATKDGWVNVDGGYAYYKDGKKLTGVHKIDGYYYDFGENGVNVGKTKYTGLVYDADAEVYRYAKFGEPVSGWQQVGEDWYHFDSKTHAATVGEAELFDGVVYNFEETGKLSTGVWAPTLYGMRYYYGPSSYWRGWYNIDGKDYCFEKSYRYESGYKLVQESNVDKVYFFNEDGSCDVERFIPDGFYSDDKGMFYSKNKIALKGLHEIDGKYYFFHYDGYAKKDGTYAGRLFKGEYTAYTGLLNKDGTLYYYENGKPTMAGLVCIDGDYYFAGGAKGEISVNKVQYIWKSNGLMAETDREFGPDGKMLNGIVDKDGTLYYYENGKPTMAGLVCIDGDYYFAGGAKGEISVNKVQYIWKSNGLIPESDREFGPDGKMLDGFVERNGEIYYYEDGKHGKVGLNYIDGYYYFIDYGGLVKRNGTYYVWETNGLSIGMNYTFDELGRVVL